MVDLPLTFSVEDDVLDLSFSVSNESMPISFEPVELVNTCKLQEKTVTPSEALQHIGPDPGYDGLSRVTVEGTRIPAAVSVKKTGSRSVVAYYLSNTELMKKTITTTYEEMEGLNVGDVLLIWFTGTRYANQPTAPRVTCSLSVVGGIWKLAVSETYSVGSGAYVGTRHGRGYLVQITDKSATITVTTT